MARRVFSASYKVGIINEAARCVRRGELAALLEREGLTTALLTKWRAVANRAALRALERPVSAPPPPNEPSSSGSKTAVAVLQELVALQNELLRRARVEANFVPAPEAQEALDALHARLGVQGASNETPPLPAATSIPGVI